MPLRTFFLSRVPNSANTRALHCPHLPSSMWGCPHGQPNIHLHPSVLLCTKAQAISSTLQSFPSFTFLNFTFQTKYLLETITSLICDICIFSNVSHFFLTISKISRPLYTICFSLLMPAIPSKWLLIFTNVIFTLLNNYFKIY